MIQNNNSENQNTQSLQMAVTSSVYLSLYLPYKAQVFTTQNFHPNTKEKPLIKRATATLTGDLFADIENGVYEGNPFKLMLNPLSNLINGILEVFEQMLNCLEEEKYYQKKPITIINLAKKVLMNAKRCHHVL